ncbi:hypothetical protein FACS189441_7710 [Betaproteobacteria bacterium]|nr:hypothetical protein FACS189441_7710 [Betaproteobacteria bacterium]
MLPVLERVNYNIYIIGAGFFNILLVAVHEKGDGWYKINTKGQEAVPLRELKNMNLNFAVNGLAAYRSYEKYGYINKEGIVVIPRRFDTATEFAPNGHLEKLPISRFFRT